MEILTKEILKEKINRLHPGDVVEIEDEMGDSYLATVERVYPNIVLFRKKNGTAVSLDYFSASQANLVKPSGYEARSEDIGMEDMEAALCNT